MAYVLNPGDTRGIDPRITPRVLSWPFEPNGTAPLQVVTGASATALLPRSTRGGDDCVRIYNSGTVAVRLRFGLDNTVTAAVTDMGIAPGAKETMRVGNSTYVATFSSAAGAVELTCGAGV